MKGQQFQINTEKATFTLFVEGLIGGQTKALLLDIHLNSSWQ